MTSRVEAVPRRLEPIAFGDSHAAVPRMRRLMAALGHPERQLPPVIHVGGAKGKGSTIAFLRAMFEAAGLRARPHPPAFWAPGGGDFPRRSQGRRRADRREPVR